MLPRLALLLTFVCVTFGCWARVQGLSHRFLWADEVVTSLRVAGYTMADIKGELFDGKRHTKAEIERFQTPGAHATPANIIRSLAREDAQHPPLYYLAERAWVGAFGNSVVARRSLATVFSILALPAVAWLMLELSASQLAASLACGLVALSPLLEIYARQAREYSLWYLLTVVSAAAIARATRLERSRRWWAFAGVSLLATAYTFLFGLFSVVSGWLYVAWGERFRPTRRLLVMSALAALTLIGFAPWLYEILTHRAELAETNAWSAAAWPLTYLAAKLCLNLASPFYDLPLLDLRTALAVIPLLVVVLAGIALTCARAPRHMRVFLATLAAPTILFVMLPDLAIHAHRSSVTRYLFPLYLALQLALAYGLAELWRMRRRALGIAALAVSALLEGGATLAQAREGLWWDNQSAWPVPQVAAYLRGPGALVVPQEWPFLLEYLPYLDASRGIYLGNVDPRIVSSSAYIYSPSDALLARFRANGYALRALPLRSAFHTSAHNVGVAALGHGASGGEISLFFAVKR